jgi:hypothetical protein
MRIEIKDDKGNIWDEGGDGDDAINTSIGDSVIVGDRNWKVYDKIWNYDTGLLTVLIIEIIH